MQLVIDIPERAYSAVEKFSQEYDLDDGVQKDIMSAILAGTKLSKQKIGRWIIDTKGIITTLYRCSECNRTVIDDTDYSPCKDYPFCHCGAKMKGVLNEDI